MLRGVAGADRSGLQMDQLTSGVTISGTYFYARWLPAIPKTSMRVSGSTSMHFQISHPLTLVHCRIPNPTYSGYIPRCNYVPVFERLGRINQYDLTARTNH